MRWDRDVLHAIAELGYALFDAGRLGDARAIWEGVASVAPADEAPHRMLALIAARERRFADAIALAGAGLERHAGPEVALLRAEAFLGLGREGEALRELERLVAAPVDPTRALVVRRAKALAARLRQGAASPGRRV